MGFVFQGNYWSSNVNEVQGFVMDQEGKVIHRLFGKWHEGLYCGVPPSAKCIWRPGRHWFTGLHISPLTGATGHLRSTESVFDNMYFVPWHISVDGVGRKVNNVDELILSFLFTLFPLLVRLHAHKLWAVLRLHQVRYWTEWALPRVERCSAPYRRPIQARSKVQHDILSCQYAAATKFENKMPLISHKPDCNMS